MVNKDEYKNQKLLNNYPILSDNNLATYNYSISN